MGFRPITNFGGGFSDVSTLWIDVREDYGAVGDGVTDDRVAIQNALNAAAAAAAAGTGLVRVWFPGGIYNASRAGANSWSLSLTGAKNITLCGDYGHSWLRHPTGMPNASVTILRLNKCTGFTFEGMGFDGNWGNAVTRVADASNLVTLPQGTINVDDTTGFPASGTFFVTDTDGALVTIAYTGKTSTTFTGCSGGTSVIARGSKCGLINSQAGTNHTTQADPKNYGLMIRGSTDITLDRCAFRNTYGDFVWIGGAADPDGIIGSENIRILSTNGNISARNGVTFGSKCRNVLIDGCRFENLFTTSADAEPGGTFKPVRNIVIRDTHLGGWWSPGSHTGNILVSIVGADATAPTQANMTRNFTLDNCEIEGAIQVFSASGVHVQNCRITLDWVGDGFAPLYVDHYCDDVWIKDNYIYDAISSSGAGALGSHQAAITVQQLLTSQDSSKPAGVHISGNRVYAKNGLAGIKIEGTGSLVANVPVSGTATAISATSLTDSGASWTSNQFAGWPLRRGSAVATVQSNTATVLTIDGWSTTTGEQTNTPSAGGYVLALPSGYITISDNFVDCGDDGRGAGTNGIWIDQDGGGPRVVIRGNTTKNCTDSGVLVEFGSAASTFRSLEIFDNLSYDDQGTPTCLQTIKFTGTPRYQKLVLRNNLNGEGVADAVTGLTTGWWMTDSGTPPRWAGWGSPEDVVVAPIGATAFRLDGGSATTFYVKESGTGNTGWVAYASPISAPPKITWFASPVGGSTTLQSYGPVLVGAVGTGTTTNPGISAGALFTRLPHIHYTGGTGAGQIASLRASGAANFMREAGYRVVQRFGVGDPTSVVATANMFVGLTGVLSAPTDVAPSTLTNIIGVGCDSGDTVMQLYCADGSPRARVSLGANFPVNTRNTDVYELELNCEPDGSTVNYILRRLNTGHVTSGVLSTNLPSSSLSMTHIWWRSNGGTAAAPAIDFFSFYGQPEA